MEKYMNNLYEEFKKSGSNDFEIWLSKEQEIVRYYKAFIETLDFIPRRGVLEFNKGKYNSVVNNLSEGIGILVSEEKINDKKNTRSINGKVLIDKKDIILEYNKIRSNINFINFFITQFPTNKETINILADLSSNDKIIFIGAYGDLNDNDKEEKLINLYNLKQELQIYLGKNFYGEVVNTSNYYLATITPKYKYKKYIIN